MGNSKNPSALAAMAGITNGDFAKNCLINGGAGMVTIGGYPIGKEMVTASMKVAQRGRKEFILNLGKEADEIVREVNKIQFFPRLIINIRVSSSKETRKFARDFSDLLEERPIIEINAHCRQDEILLKGGGQGLLQRFEVLTEIIEALRFSDFKISLKIRGNAVNSDLFIPKVNQWYIDFLHIDSYKIGEKGTDLTLLQHYARKVNSPLIGNNSVVDIKSAQAILNTGAKFFSVARAARENPFIFKTLIKHF